MPDESTEVIEQQMQETRDSLTQKVSALESQVVGTLQSATTTVSDMVEQVKTAVPESLAGVKDTISEVKESIAKQVRETLDVSQRTRENPWAMVGGAAAAGFIAGMVLFRRTYAAPIASTAPATAYGGASSYPTTHSVAPAVSGLSGIKLPGWLDQIVDKLGGQVTAEVRKLGELAVASASSSLKQTVEQVVPEMLGKIGKAVGATDRMEGDMNKNGFHATSGSRI